MRKLSKRDWWRRPSVDLVCLVGGLSVVTGAGTCNGWGFKTTDNSDISSPACVLADVDKVSSVGASVCLSSQESGTAGYLSPM